MNGEMKMSVSSMTRLGDKKGVYVLFTDGNSSAEFVVPDCKLIHSNGFNVEELKQLKDYVENEQDSIFRLAKGIDPVKSFLGDTK